LVLKALCERIAQAMQACSVNPYPQGALIWVHGDTEVNNTTAQRWFASQGFEPLVKNTWLLVTIDL
jgi:hypothetical protein